jgi:hypothetical protein
MALLSFLTLASWIAIPVCLRDIIGPGSLRHSDRL